MSCFMSTVKIMSKSTMSKAIISRLIPFSTSQQWHHTYMKPSIVAKGSRGYFRLFSTSFGRGDAVVRNLLAEVEREKQRERDQRKKAGLGTADIDAEDDEDYMGVSPLIKKLEKENQKHVEPRLLYMREEPTDSESEEEDHRFTREAIRLRKEVFRKKLQRRDELVRNFARSENIDDACKWIHKIDKFEEKHLPLLPEYRVIGDMMNRLKEATGKEKFMLHQKLNRAIKLVKWKEAYDPNNPSNYGVIKSMDKPHYDRAKGSSAEMDTQLMESKLDDDEEEEFDDIKEKDNFLVGKITDIDRMLEVKLAQLNHTFGRKRLVLEQEIIDLVGERNSLLEKKRTPLYRKGFDVKVVQLRTTSTVRKAGRMLKKSVLLVCGNYHGVIGFAKAKGKKIPVVCQKAHEKCFQNLHYVERHEGHTIAHAIQTSYKRTKVYLWPGPTQGGMKAGRIVQTILTLAGFKNVKAKIVGSRNPHNVVKAVFKGLNAIETPKDVQEKFGRVVADSYLL